MNKAFPPRIHVLLARDKPTGVVFRRGPSKQVSSFLWNRETDQFSVGQWLNGRIYERRSDISPDGRFMIYFAMNGKWTSETGGSWTAISRAPWLKAISLYAKGDCWEGGGLFISATEFWLNDRYFSAGRILTESKEVRCLKDYAPPHRYGAEDTGVYYVRLQRDGWRLVDRRRENGKLDAAMIFERTLPNGWMLRKIAHEQVGSPPGKGCYWDEHQLISSKGDTQAYPDWEWAELDRNRIVWAEKGCLWQMQLDNKGAIGEKSMIHDFSAYKFEPIEAPY